jgi:saccharopine dehydrogenase (NADP+, L-glutamate forming)
MSAMQLIDKIKEEGGTINSFYSFTGGLISPSTDPENPWRYKFTWNGRNVVMAGQGTAKYLDDGVYKYIPYQQLFTRTTDVHVDGYGDYEGYANRDSLKYISAYGLDNVKTMVRGTLRAKGFCSAWNILVQLGCCDDTFQIDAGRMSHLNFISSFVKSSNSPIKTILSTQFNLSVNSNEIKLLDWSGLFSDELIGMTKGTPAQILEHILNKKWKLKTEDKDQIVMWHKLTYTLDNKDKEIHACLVSTGENSIHTAMAKTVGLPMGIAAKLLALDKIKSRGVVIPTAPEFYIPVLKELSELGIEMQEKQVH